MTAQVPTPVALGVQVDVHFRAPYACDRVFRCLHSTSIISVKATVMRHELESQSVAALRGSKDHILQCNGVIFSVLARCPHGIIENIYKNSAPSIRGRRDAEQRHTRAFMDAPGGQEHEVMRCRKLFHDRTEGDLLDSCR